MAVQERPRLRNDIGVAEIAVGATEFECIGASPPHDHPHVFLDMGSATQIRCPYCGTLFVYKASLASGEAEPPECIA